VSGGTPLKADSMVVIGDDKKLTDEEVRKAKSSSDMDYINSVRVTE